MAKPKKPILNTLQAILKDSVSQYGDKIAYTNRTTCTLTYKDLGQETSAFGFFLAKHGIRQFDKVGLIGENMPQWGVSYFGIASIGAVIVPILVDFSLTEITTVLCHAEVKALILSEKVYKKIVKDCQK